MIRYGRGDFIPWFKAATNRNPNFLFETLAGRIVILTMFPSSKHPAMQRLIQRLAGLDLLDDHRVIWFGLSADGDDIKPEAGLHRPPRLRCFVDGSGKLLHRLRAADLETGELQAQTLVLGPKLRVLDGQMVGDPDKHIDWLVATVKRELEHDREFAEKQFAPVLLIEDVFEPEFCRMLISLYENGNPGDSGFMETKNGMTIGKIDHSFKRRKDYHILDENVREGMRARINARLVAAIERAFYFKATRIERYIVACYDGADHGHFQAHRDNTTPGTAHRRFAVTINLNAEDYEGGELCFPEFGPRTYRAPTGGAVVFCCSLQHRAMPVLSGVRYCTLPFLYDDEAAEIRQANAKTIISEDEFAKKGEAAPQEAAPQEAATQ